MERIYMDNAATTRVKPEVLEAMLPFYGDVYGNPSTIYSFGREAKAALERAVEAMRTYLNAQGAFEITPPYVAFYDGMLVFSAKRIAR